MGLLDESLAKATAGSGPSVLAGKDLFRLYDTFGFPIELARDIAAEQGVALDEVGFEAEMNKQRSRAQASWKQSGREEVAEAYSELAAEHATRFVGYDVMRLDAVPVLALLDAQGRPASQLEQGQDGEIVLEATPFYAEAGGQVADTGWLTGSDGRVEVRDVQRPVRGLLVHRVQVARGRIATGDELACEVDEGRRARVRRNHTATHLLHAALREVVGTHVKQAGSLVAPDRLRFDFSHFAALTERALSDIELLVNRRLLEDMPVVTEEMDRDDALRCGAMALFGEKYGERVRVVTIGDFSRELCGGTHCERSGEIGLVKLIQERGIASGTRRVEALWRTCLDNIGMIHCN